MDSIFSFRKDLQALPQFQHHLQHSHNVSKADIGVSCSTFLQLWVVQIKHEIPHLQSWGFSSDPITKWLSQLMLSLKGSAVTGCLNSTVTQMDSSYLEGASEMLPSARRPSWPAAGEKSGQYVGKCCIWIPIPQFSIAEGGGCCLTGTSTVSQDQLSALWPITMIWIFVLIDWKQDCQSSCFGMLLCVFKHNHN